MGKALTTACACVVGWHFHEHVLSHLAQQPDLDVFVLSHRPRAHIPGYVSEYVAHPRILVRPNVGYDWGGYQQFLELGAYRGYEFVFLLHDDLVFHAPGWLEASIALLNQGRAVVGNGSAGTDDWAEQTPWCYAPARWKPPSPGYRHQVVRGSFFATTSAVLSRLQRLEVFWDWMHLSVGFGNWSLRATCGKLHSVYGAGGFGFLSDAARRSEYVTELFRGGGPAHDVSDRPRGVRGALYDARRPGRVKLHLVDAYQRVCKQYMSYYYRGDWRMCRLLEPVVRFPARRRLGCQ